MDKWTRIRRDVFAIDGAGNTGRQEFDIQVNASLQIAIEGDTEAAEETTLSFLVRAWDADDLDAAVDISLHDTTLPDGSSRPGQLRHHGPRDRRRCAREG